MWPTARCCWPCCWCCSPPRATACPKGFPSSGRACLPPPRPSGTGGRKWAGTCFDYRHRSRHHGFEHTPESVSALILRSLVEDARAQLGEDSPVRAVVTVPAYFGIREREATFQAARLAGIEVLELLAEPVAAALHYGAMAGSPG